MENSSTGMTSLDIIESYKVLLPSSISVTTLDKCVTFCSNSSRPMTFNGLSKDRCVELLGSLLNCMFENFRACSNPESYLERADESKKESENILQKVILVGASNLRNSRPHFDGTSTRTIDATVPGWTATPENISSLCTYTIAMASQASAFVFDILGNSVVRFEQFDGTTSLPFKSNGIFHQGGNVVVSSPEIFKKLVDSVTPIFKAKGDRPCVIIPPLPRFVFARCCNDAGHCTNANNDDFSKDLLQGFMKLRNDLIKTLVQNGLTGFKVLDCCCVTSCSPTAAISERLDGLRKVTARNGIHFTVDGYRNLAARTNNCLQSLTKNPVQLPKKMNHFWRGFRSGRGSTVPRSRATSLRGATGTPRGAFRGNSRGSNPNVRGRHYHPYRKKKGKFIHLKMKMTMKISPGRFCCGWVITVHYLTTINFVCDVH